MALSEPPLWAAGESCVERRKRRARQSSAAGLEIGSEIGKRTALARVLWSEVFLKSGRERDL